MKFFSMFIVFLILNLDCSATNKRINYKILVLINEQKLYVYRNNKVIKSYPVSTSKYGVGNKMGSNTTPLGLHRIKKKIGGNAPLGMIFVGCKPTGKIAKIYTDKTDLEEDFVTTRILVLEGLQPGINKGGNVDSERRKIYIHGTPEEGLIGTPASHGCIRMKNLDIVELFNIVPVGTLVEIIK